MLYQSVLRSIKTSTADVRTIYNKDMQSAVLYDSCRTADVSSTTLLELSDRSTSATVFIVKDVNLKGLLPVHVFPY